MSAYPELMSGERERLIMRPLARTNPQRTHPLKGKLSTKSVGGVRLPQWQHEITGSGRIWYCPDKVNRIIWITRVSFTHPKETE